MIIGKINRYSKSNSFVLSCCEKIAEENNVKNGGTLHFSDVLKDCDIIFCFESQNEIVGYIGLKYYNCFENAIYVEQICVSKKYIRNKIATRLLENAELYCARNNIKRLIANVRKENLPSNSLFQSLNYEIFDMSDLEYQTLGFEIKDTVFNNAYKKELVISLRH